VVIPGVNPHIQGKSQSPLFFNRFRATSFDSASDGIGIITVGVFGIGDKSTVGFVSVKGIDEFEQLKVVMLIKMNIFSFENMIFINES